MTPRLAVKQADLAVWRVALAFTAVYLIWGSTYLAIRFAIAGLPPFLMSGVRHFTAGLVLFAIARMARGRRLLPVPQWIATAIIGGLLLLGGNGGVVWAESRIPSGLASVMVATVPLVDDSPGDWVRPHRRPSPGRVLWGLLIGFAGACRRRVP